MLLDVTVRVHSRDNKSRQVNARPWRRMRPSFAVAMQLILAKQPDLVGLA
jgi:hypothetical protein